MTSRVADRADGHFLTLGSDTDYSTIFRPSEKGTLVKPNVHTEPLPRSPDYTEISKLVRQPGSGTTEREDKGRE
jgi:hypothetical protein